jgi:uncharacterized protein YggE
MPTYRLRPYAVSIAGVLAIVAAIVVALLRTGPAPAAAATGPATVVTVVGTGTADGTPDTLTVDFTVSATRSTVQTALDAQAAATRRVFAALQSHGVGRKEIATTNLELDRHYDSHGVATGFEASETVEARIAPLARAGRTITAAATSAGDMVQVGDMSFDIASDKTLLGSARSNAFADAKARAQQYAQLSGRSLGAVQKITEVVAAPTPPTFYGTAGLSADSAKRVAAEPLRAGQQTLTVNVTVSWSLT